jgi:hypothetical protein
MATYWVTQSGAGSANGSNLSNAWSVTNFNTSGNWSGSVGTAGKISPGDTVMLHGTFSGTSAKIAFQGGGTSGHPITVLFDTGAFFTAPTWGNQVTAAITSSGFNWNILDGGAVGTIGGYGATGTTNGYIECTSNGTGLTTSDGVTGVDFNFGNNLIVRNLLLSNLYVATNGDNGTAGTGVTMLAHGGASANQHDCLITNCVCHDVQNGFFIEPGVGTFNMTLSFVTSYNCNWGGGAGVAASGESITNLIVHDCYFHDWENWDSPSDTSHHNGFYAFAENGGTIITGITMYNIVVGPNFGGVNNTSTAGLFISGPGINGTNLIYNIIGVVNPTGDGGPNDALIFVWPGDGSTTNIYNCTLQTQGNSCIELYGSQLTTGANFNLANNIYIGGVAVAAQVINGLTGGTVLLHVTSDHDVFFNLSSGGNFSYSTATNGAASFQTLTQWKANSFAPESTFSSTSTPNLNSSFVPVATSSAIGNGANLTTTFTTDFYGTARPSSGAWDIGAAQSGGSPPVSASITNTSKLSAAIGCSF